GVGRRGGQGAVVVVDNLDLDGDHVVIVGVARLAVVDLTDGVGEVGGALGVLGEGDPRSEDPAQADVLGGVGDVSVRKMMGEYLLYASGKLFGGIYDDRFLVKDTPASRDRLPFSEIPYEGAAPMLLVDTEDAEAVAELVEAMLPELPEPRKRR
ncbi:MAG: TfoX/Sxy family protein, partial [Coriobacteriaceae bacterium]|nr:TfoX/Sxy family protein [Coriobacteriaceae bacterium]